MEVHWIEQICTEQINTVFSKGSKIYDFFLFTNHYHLFLLIFANLKLGTVTVTSKENMKYLESF